MKFALNEMQALLQEQTGRLLAEHGTHETLQSQIAGSGESGAGAWGALRDMGLAGLLVPEESGGAGLGLIEAALISEMIGYNAVPTPLFGHWAATAVLGPEQVPDMAGISSGDKIVTVAFGEESGIWFPGQWNASFADGVVNGTKAYVTNAEDADLILVGVTGGGAALVDARAAGVRMSPMAGIDATRPMHKIEFDGVPATALTPALASRAFDAATILLAADAFGGARRALDMTVDYAKTREQFGAVIGSFQAVKHQLANVAVQVEPCRALYWYAAYAFDHEPGETPSMASLAKAHITDRFLQVCRDCVELHGGIGYTWEYDLHIWLKRAMADFAWGGAPDSHRRRYADAVGW